MDDLNYDFPRVLGNVYELTLDEVETLEDLSRCPEPKSKELVEIKDMVRLIRNYLIFLCGIILLKYILG